MYIPSRTSTNHTLEALALASSSVPPPGTGTRLEPEQPPPCRSDNEDEDDDTTTPACFCPPLHGMSLDVQARLPLYPDDWRVPVCSSPRTLFKLLNATLFAFVVQLIPALIFAEVLEKQTHGAISVVETLLSSGIIGLLYAVFSGQPLVLVGITGPVAILLGTSYQLAAQFDSDYWPFFWWMCMWTALLHVITAMIGLVNLVWKITPFTTQIFEFFIATTFIYESLRDLLVPLHLLGDSRSSTAYAGFVLGMGTFVICWTCHFAETWNLLPPSLKAFLASYNMLLAITIMTGLSYLPGIDQSPSSSTGTSTGTHSAGLERVQVEVPWNWQPSDTDHRTGWLINPLEGITVTGIFGALFPAFMLYLLFFIDHNISSILTQAPQYNLTKPPAYHWDFFVLGLTIIPCGLMGLPPGSGLIPQAPMHTRALCDKKYEILHGRSQEIFFDCEEQRYSAFLQAALMFVALGCLVVISWIPIACLYGTFLYLGVGALHGNEIWERMTLALVPKLDRPPLPIVTKVAKWSTVVLYTAIQIMLAMVTFGISQFVSWGYVFPALIALFVPFRSYVVSKLFTESDLRYLDPTTEEEIDIIAITEHQEKQQQRRSSVVGGISEFRSSTGNPRNPSEYYEQHPNNINIGEVRQRKSCHVRNSSG